MKGYSWHISSRSGKRGCSGCILKVDWKEFSNVLDMGYDKKEESKDDFMVLAWATWNIRLPFTEEGKGCGIIDEESRVQMIRIFP